MEEQQIKDIQALINIFFPFAEELIIKYGEFYPFAGATTNAGEFVSVGNAEKNKQMDPEIVIANLKHALQKGNSEYLVVIIFYEARTKDNITGETSDAIAVFVEHKNAKTAYEFFYPYKVEGKENFTVGDTFGNTIPREIFYQNLQNL